MAKHAPIFNSRFAPINVWFVSLKQSYTEYNRGCMTKKISFVQSDYPRVKAGENLKCF